MARTAERYHKKTHGYLHGKKKYKTGKCKINSTPLVEEWPKDESCPRRKTYGSRKRKHGSKRLYKKQ